MNEFVSFGLCLVECTVFNWCADNGCKVYLYWIILIISKPSFLSQHYRHHMSITPFFGHIVNIKKTQKYDFVTIETVLSWNIIINVLQFSYSHSSLLLHSLEFYSSHLLSWYMTMSWNLLRCKLTVNDSPIE